MANTFSKIYIHIVFSVKNRDSMLRDEWRDELWRYMGGVIKKMGQAPMAIGGWRNHVHILVGCKTQVQIAEMVKTVKLSSHQWIQQRHRSLFAWQDGYSCFSVSPSALPDVRHYVENQVTHHSKVSSRDEMIGLLRANSVEFDERYLPEFFD